PSALPHPHPFPTRRSSDLTGAARQRSDRRTAMSDTIFIHGLLIHARHGVLEHEAEVGQRFVIDLELSTDLSEPSRTDKLKDTISDRKSTRLNSSHVAISYA